MKVRSFSFGKITVENGNRAHGIGALDMLARLKKCRDLVKLATNNDLDLLAEPEYQALKDFFDAQPNI